jgi:hypothetical protein
MPVQSKETLKSYFNAGDVPTEANYVDLIDSMGSPAHANTHKNYGIDPIKLDELGTPDDNLNLNATITAHGLLAKLTGLVSQVLRGDGTWGDYSYVHAVDHKSSGTDPIKLDELAAPTDVTTLNTNSSRHGLMPKLNGNKDSVFKGDGNWGTHLHASTHKNLGNDSIRLDEFASPIDNTNLNASSTAHGLLPKLSGLTSQVLLGDGTFSSYGVVTLAVATRTSVLACANNTWTVIPFTQEILDTHNFHSTASNVSRITIPSAGYYMLGATVAFASNATGSRAIGIKKNASGNVNNGTWISLYTTEAVSATGMTTYMSVFTPVILCSLNDYFEVFINQTSGGSLDTRYDAGTPDLPAFTIQRISPSTF